MSTKASGESTVHFEFYDEMDAVLGRDPAYKPISTASSISGFKRPEASGSVCDEDSDDEENVASPLKKKKKVSVQREMLKMMKEMNEDRKARNNQKKISERNKDDMRQQLMAQQQENSDKFLTLMGQIVNKF